MRILVTGRNGQVAQSLAERAGPRRELIFADRPGLDLAVGASIDETVAAVRPDLVFSVAAYTAVDKAESEPEAAMAVNRDGAGVLARAAARIGAPIVHLSTDYVFDGGKAAPYSEADPVGPIGVYGATKLAGERLVAQSGADYAILRTAWVYSPFGNNFVKTMLRLAADRDLLNVVDDQLGCPTSALDIADAMLQVADRWEAAPGARATGIYHLAGTGEANWADFARAIFAFSVAAGGPGAQVDGIPTSAYPTPARRPANSRLNSDRFAEVFGYRAPDWRKSLEAVVKRLVG